MIKHYTYVKSLVLSLLLIGSIALQAQNYVRTTFTAPYVPISIAGGATASTATGDGVIQKIPIGFTFNYYGVPYDSITVSTDGFASFTATVNSLSNTNLYTATAPNAVIAPWWDDLTTSEILYQTTLNPLGQVLTIQWTSLSYWSGSTRTINYQIKLYQFTDVIEMHYSQAPITGTVNTAESASIGICNQTGGPGNYIDAITGSSVVNNSMMNSLKWPKVNFRFTPGTTTPLLGGFLNVGIGQNYNTLWEAVADINHRGSTNTIILNLTDALYDSSAAGGYNMFPVVIAPTASGPTNPLIINGNNATLAWYGSLSGNLGNQTTTAAAGTTSEPIIAIMGADNVVISSLNFNGSFPSSLNRVDRAILITNLNATDGAQDNTITDVNITLDRTNTSSIGIQSSVPTTPTAPSGTNSNNIIRNFTIKNSYAGINLTGNATIPDLNNSITNSVCTNFNTIGDPATPNDIGNGTTATYGIQLSNQRAFTVSNNRISNVTNTGGLAEGINIITYQGICSVNNNIINGIRNAGAASLSVASGIRATHATTGNNVLRIYNNSISNITSGYTGAPSATRVIRAINISGTGGTTSQEYEIYNNSVSIDGSASPNISSVCLEIATVSGPVFKIANNNFANFTTAQTGIARHYIYCSTAANSFGNTGSFSNNNNLFILNDVGTTGFIGLGNITNYATLANWQTAMSQDGASLSVNPNYINNNSDLHATNLLLNSAGQTPPPYLTQDLDCAGRSFDNDIGAYIINACSGTPTAGTITGVNAVCNGQGTTLTLNGASTDAGIVYQWGVSSTPGGPYTNLGTSNTQATGPLTANAYYIVTVTCVPSSQSATTAEKVVAVNPLPNVSVSPATVSYCSGSPAIPLTASGANTYTWSPAAGLSATTGATVNANPSSTTIYTVTGTDANGCSNTATVNFNVITTPVITSVTATPQNLCSGDTSQLQVIAITDAPIKITEVTVFRTGTGQTTPYPAYVIGQDLVEISNISSASYDISGFSLRAFGNNNGTASHTITFPSGTIIPANGVAVIHLGTGTDDPSNLYFNTGGSNDSYFSTSQVGIVLYNGSTIVDAVGLGGSVSGSYTFAPATGVSPSDFSGFAPNASGLAGVRRTAASDSNTGADWTGSSGTNVQTIGTYDNIYTPPTPPVLSYTWTPATFLSATNIANPLAQNVTGTTTYTVTVDNNGCSISDSVTVTIDLLTLTFGATPNDTVCQGSNITLQSNPVGGGQPYTYSWTGPNNFTSTVQNPVINNAQPNASGYYVLQLTDNCGTTLTDSIQITVLPNPIVTVTPDTAVFCNPGAPVTLTASGANTYTWAPAAGLSATTGVSVDASPTVNTNYIVTGTDLFGCIGKDTAVVNVVLAPVISSVTATPSTICQGDSAQLDILLQTSNYCTPTVGITGATGDYIDGVVFSDLSNLNSGDNPSDYQYYSLLTANVIADGTTPYTLTLTPTTSWSQQFRVWIDFNQNGIFEAAESVYNTTTATTSPVTTTITIPNTAINGMTRMRVACRFSTIILDTEACGHAGFGEFEDYNVMITGGQSAALTYAWSPASSLTNASISNPFAMPNANETYTVVVTNANGCSATDSVSIQVNPSPIVDLGADTIVCGGTSLVLDAGTNGDTYLWNDNSTNQTLTVTANGVYTVTVTELLNNCSTTDSISVTFGTIPTVSLGADTTICSGSNLTINAGAGFAAYNWNTGATSQTISVNTANTYTVTVTNNDGCEASDTVVVSVNPSPIVNLGSDTTICNNQNLTLNAGAGFVSYSWTPSGNTPSITVTGANTVNTYTVTVTDNNGCSNTDTIVVTFNTCAGDKEEEMNNYISLYPNPNNGTFFVDVISQSNSVELNLVDLTGKVIYSEIVNSGNITRKQLDLQSQPAGIYLLVIKSDNMSKTLRISKY
jgi:hypothetical protein